MLETAQQWLNWIAGHPTLACLILFLTALLDAIFILGAFVPASIVLFGMGALVAFGAVDLWPTVLIAAGGALLGDLLSFWLGRRYGERLFSGRLLSRYPELVRNGRAFFTRHGGKGVFLARFMGPVRSVTPAMGGASGMPLWLFALADGSASALWAMLYILPGVAFGASLGLAAEVASRLASLLLIGVFAAALSVWLTSLLISFLQIRAEGWLGAILDWSRRHRRLGRFGAVLADPNQPETPALAVIAGVLLAAAGVAIWTWTLVGGTDYPFRVDALIYSAFEDLHTPWGNWLALSFAQLGAAEVYLPVAVTVLATLLLRRKTRAAAHWIAAVAFGALISLGLHTFPWLPGPVTYYHGIEPRDFIGRDLVMLTVIYGFVPVLLSTQRPMRVRRAAYSAATILLILIIMARLYLGVEWASQTLFAAVVSLLWLFALGVGYRRHQPERVFATGFLWPVLSVFLAAAALQWSVSPEIPERLLPEHGQAQLSAPTWWQQGYTELPPRRIDLRGQPGPPFSFQWAGALGDIEQALRSQGWDTPPEPKGTHLLLWLTDSIPVAELPVLPQVHAGSHQALVLRYSVDAERQWLIRLWPSGWSLGEAPTIWVGTLNAQRARTYYRVFRYPVTEPDAVIDWKPPPPYVQRQVTGVAGPLRLIARPDLVPVSRYTEVTPPQAAPQNPTADNPTPMTPTANVTQGAE